MLLDLLKHLIHRPPLQPVASPAAALDDTGFYRALRNGNHDPALLIAHARWLMTRAPLHAAELLQEAGRRQPTSPAPPYWLGETHLQLGNRQSAAECFHTALLRDEDLAAAWHGLARARHAQGRATEAAHAETQWSRLSRPAKADFSEASALPAINSDAPASGARLALYLAQSARPRAALKMAIEICRLDPDDSVAVLALATAQAALGKYRDACTSCRQGLLLTPDDPELECLLADCIGMEDEVSALEHYRALVFKHPAPPATLLNNYGCALSRTDRFEEAVPPLRKARALEPDLQKIQLNLAYALTYIGKRDEAQALLDALIAEEPHHFEAHWYRSHLKLACHDLAVGWQDYRYRFAAAATAIRPLPMQRWSGESLDAQKSLLVTAEQGIGDEIMFAGCLGQLQGRVANITLECDPRLHALFARSFPGIQITDKAVTNTQLPAPADYFVPAGDLPEWFLPDIGSFHLNTTPYLVANNIEVATFQRRLATLGPGLKVGIAWRGGAITSRRNLRSLSLDTLSPLLDVPNCQFISLQYGDCSAEIEQARIRGYPITHWPEAMTDLDMFAALVSALDIVISVCSAPVHFCGGLGQRAWVLTPFAPEWRYSTHEGHMLWYPSVSLLQQAAFEDWQSVITTAVHKLGQAANRRFTEQEVTNCGTLG